MGHQQHLEYSVRPKEFAGSFRCAACGTSLLATLRARLNRTTCMAEEARRCDDHPMAMPLAWTQSRSRNMELLERWAKDGSVEAYLTGYAREGGKAQIMYPGTTLDGLREMVFWGRHWGLFGQDAVRS